MTVTYTAEVATCRWFGTLFKLLFRWRGSVYKLIWLDLLAFLTLFYSLDVINRFYLDDVQKIVFINIVRYCAEYSNLIPLSFVLGFYVTIIMNRWWEQYTTIPWPDVVALFVSANLHGHDDRGRLMRRTVVRYMCLCQAMCFMHTSTRVKKRFPNLKFMVDMGILLDNEKDIIEELISRFPKHSKHWMPLMWATSIITRARKEGRIRDDIAVNTIIEAIQTFRAKCNRLISYNTISVPLIYTQVVTLAVYSYFVTQAMGAQYIGDDTKPNLYFPFFTTLQFFFYMGWLKVAEQLINPFGEDDDDFELNWLIDRNLQVCYMLVDEMHHEHPELIKDQYWDEVFPIEVPYTAENEKYREQVPESSTAKIKISEKNTTPTHLSSVEINEKTNQENGGNIRHSLVGDQSLKGTLPRVATALNKFLRSNSTEAETYSAPVSRSSSFFRNRRTSIERSSKSKSVNISGQVIEEQDEQLTDLSKSKLKEFSQRPGIVNFFDAMEGFNKADSVHLSRQTTKGDDDNVVKRAPVKDNESDSLSRVTVEDLTFQDVDDDEFERLRYTRARNRQFRNQLRLARSISAQSYDTMSVCFSKSPTILEENLFFSSDDLQVSKFTGAT